MAIANFRVWSSRLHDGSRDTSLYTTCLRGSTKLLAIPTAAAVTAVERNSKTAVMQVFSAQLSAIRREREGSGCQFLERVH